MTDPDVEPKFIQKPSRATNDQSDQSGKLDEKDHKARLKEVIPTERHAQSVIKPDPTAHAQTPLP